MQSGHPSFAFVYKLRNKLLLTLRSLFFNLSVQSYAQALPTAVSHRLRVPDLALRQQRREQCRAEGDAAAQVQQARVLLPADLVRGQGREERLRGERGDDAKKAAEEARNSTRRAADVTGEGLGRPAVQDGVEHALEEVLQDTQPDVGSLAVDGREEEERHGHQRRGDDHGPLPAHAGEVVAQYAEEDANDAGQVDVDVGAVGVVEGEVKGGVLFREDEGGVGACGVKGLAAKIELRIMARKKPDRGNESISLCRYWMTYQRW